MSIRRILDPRVLRGYYQQVQKTAPTALVDYYNVNPVQATREEYIMLYDPLENRPAPVNVFGGEARILDLAGLEEKKGALIPVFNKLKLPDWMLRALRTPESNDILDEKGRREVTRQNDKFARRHRITKELAYAKILATGSLIIDSVGNILDTAGATDITMDFGIPASRKAQAGGLWALSLANPAADIQAYFDAIDEEAEKSNHEPPTEVWVNGKFKNLLTANTDFREWAAASATMPDKMLSGQWLEGLFGKNWHFYNAHYRSAAGTTLPYIPDDRMILTPPAGGAWVEASDGSQLVPTNLNLQAGALEALNSTEVIYGEFSYAKIVDDPWALWIYMGDTFGLNFPEPLAIWQIDTVF